MESNVQQLKTTLHCDDKEKLRRKLALLQREYLRTAQRLQRAERLDAVRKHVKSRISQQNHQDQRDKEAASNPSPVTLNPATAAAQDVRQCHGHSEGPADSGNITRTPVIRFLLPSEAACPQTPDSSYGATQDHRPSPALRLRSRRSRLRWERRSAEACRTTENSEEGQEQSEGTEGARTDGEEEKVTSQVVNECEEFPASESESPSLLLTHWSTQTGGMEGKETQDNQEISEKGSEKGAEGKKDSESPSVFLKCSDSAVHTEEKEQNFTMNGETETQGGDDGGNGRGQGDAPLCEESSNNDMEQNAADKTEKQNEHDDTMEMKEEKTGVGGNGKSVGLLDSCTLVEGLLFPAEYYVRTTRRMTSSQSQPDMQAVILSQLSVGRQRRSRGRGRGLNRHAQSDSSPSATTPADPDKSSASAELTDGSQSLSDTSYEVCSDQTNKDASFSPVVNTTHPGRGRGRRRGRGRGRGRGRSHTPRPSQSLDAHQNLFEQTSDDPPLISTPVSSPSSLHGADGLRPCLTPVLDDPQPVSTPQSTATQPAPGANGAQCSPAPGRLEKLYPIFLKSSGTPSQNSRATSSRRSLLLPSSSSPSQTPPPTPLSLSSLANSLVNFDIHQDFHLPDDQFASLKLHKLRQVTVESGVEHFASPSYNTRSSNRRFGPDPCCSSGDPVVPLSLPLSLTPTITSSHQQRREKQAAPSMSADHKLVNQSSAEDPSSQVIETSAEQQPQNLHANTPTRSAEQDTHRPVDPHVKPQPHSDFTDTAGGRVSNGVVGPSDEIKRKEAASEKRADCVVRPAEPRRGEKSVVKTLSFDCPEQEAPEEPSHSCAAAQTCNDSGAPGASPVKSAARDSEDCSEPASPPPTGRAVENKAALLSPPPASAPCPFVTPHLPSSALLSSPALPSLGLTPCPVSASLPLTPSPSAPALTLPPPHSPSTQALSPPALSPCRSIPPLPLSQPPASPSSQNQVLSGTAEPGHRVEPPPCAAASCLQSQGVGGQVAERAEETAEEDVMRCTHTLEAPAGGCLVDTCCLPGPSGGLYVAAAGKWAVCLWSQTSASDWRLTHTWTFNDPVINVFPVPDAAGLLFVTLGQLEIREVRMLSCSSHKQVLLCEGVVQAVVGVSKSRVVSSSHSATGSTLQVFDLSDDSSTPSSQPLVSPGVCVGALAPVDGLPDALIGTDEAGRVFVWNLKSGQLLRRIELGDGLSRTACLRGYSCSGVLFVLLQHQLLSSLEEEEGGKEENEEERKRNALFSLVAVNPLSSKSVLATRLYPPTAWSGRLCEADVCSSSVVGLSQSGCVCVWELGRRASSRMVRAPEGDGWQLARWGGRGTLVTGHHNGDVTIHCLSSTSPQHGNADTYVTFIKH